jgi:hypothetical protein
MNIAKIIASINKLHGSEQSQAAAHRAYLDFLRHKREQLSGEKQ